MNKKQKITAIALTALACGLLAGKASAAPSTETYYDTWNTFPGWEAFMGGVDSYGDPKISKMDVVYQEVAGERILDSVVIYLEDRLVWDSLFINADYDKSNGEIWDAWDYMVRDQREAGYWEKGEAGYLTDLGSDMGFYEVASDYNYTTATRPNAREGHANGIYVGDLTWVELDINDDFITYNGSELVYNFSYLYTAGLAEIILGDSYMIAYSPWCANDVIGTVPEPGTLLLFGAGLAGLVGIARRRIQL